MFTDKLYNYNNDIRLIKIPATKNRSSSFLVFAIYFRPILNATSTPRRENCHPDNLTVDRDFSSFPGKYFSIKEVEPRGLYGDVNLVN